MIPERHKKILDLTKQGIYMQETARLVGVHETTVSKVLKRYGVEPERKIHPQYKNIVSLLNERVPVVEIARKLRASQSFVTRVRKELGIPSYRTSRPTPPDRLERAASMLNDGAPFAEVARTLKMSTDTLRKYFPGMAWGREQIDEYMSAIQKARKVESRKGGVGHA